MEAAEPTVGVGWRKEEGREALLLLSVASGARMCRNSARASNACTETSSVPTLVAAAWEETSRCSASSSSAAGARTGVRPSGASTATCMSGGCTRVRGCHSYLCSVSVNDTCMHQAEEVRHGQGHACARCETKASVPTATCHRVSASAGRFPPFMYCPPVPSHDEVLPDGGHTEV